MHGQLNLIAEGKAFTPKAPKKRKPKVPFNQEWWDRFAFVMSTIRLDPDGTPVSVVQSWVEPWDIRLNPKELLDALVGLGHPVAMRLKSRTSGAAHWIVKPIPDGGVRRPSLSPTVT